ncbi:AmiS/UreI family transporter [Serratia sp. DD3]|uniref:AmiS/UreI family transporter n=1 Tax=Serratia sp. DD3 TaxID=1410619 RepID=UPI0003C504DE|nr:AmiS/UreI family transporter [Serratia sp. DD3]KEY58543.1 acid-activated urea channel [Serratia sp. DD3]
MLGLSLLFIGAVLLVNAQSLYGRVAARECAPFNLLVGLLALGVNALGIVRATDNPALLAAAGGLLFAFTYLYLSVVQWWSLDGSGFGWYCLFVAINTLVFALLSVNQKAWLFTVLWLAWGCLWLMFFIAQGLKRDLGRALPHMTLLVGIFTCWLPGILMLTGNWPN